MELWNSGQNGLENERVRYNIKGLGLIKEDPLRIRQMVESHVRKMGCQGNLRANIRVKALHKQADNCKYQVNLLVTDNRKNYISESTDKNIFVALTDVFENARQQIMKY